MRHPFSCPNCKAHYQIPTEFEGKILSCAKCGGRIAVHLKKAGEADVAVADESLFIPIDDRIMMIGKLALKLKYLTREQLKATVQKQQELKAAGEGILLGELLVREGLLSEIQRDYIVSVLELNETRKGDELFRGIISQNAFASQDQIDKGFDAQKRLFNEKHISRSIIDILTEEGDISQEQHDCATLIQERLQQHIQEEGLSVPIAELISTEGMITPEEMSAAQNIEDEVLVEESLPPPFTIKIPGDKLTAILLIGEEATEMPSLEAIKDELESQGVIYNIKPDDEIELFLQGEPDPDESLQIATGIVPGKSTDASIECKFDEDPLKIGHMKSNGVVDFKDRGEIPQVKKNDIIAVKIPKEQGENGIDIFGQKIDSRKPDDIKLRCGKGADLSLDKLTVTAVIDGKPVKTPTRIIDVLPLLQINGDVGLETGHIHFDGDIQVQGMVESGFQVTGGSLTANELDGAIVDIRGDLHIRGGIIKSQVRAGGNLKAKYIRKSKVNVVGDVVVDTEVMQSQMQIGGEFLSEKCHVFSSTIDLGGSITVRNIGSEASRASTVTLGSAGAYDTEKKNLSTALAHQQEIIDKLGEQLGELEKQNEALNEEIGVAAQLQDSAMVKKRNEPDAPGVDEEFKAAEEKLNALFDSQDKLAADIQELKERQQAPERIAEMKHIESEIEALDTMIEQEEKKNRQYLHVKGELYEKTTIKARRTTLTSDTTVHKVSIFEEAYTDKNGIDTWRMKVDSLQV